MRQAGLKPKNHNSGVYWVRASSSPGGERQVKSEEPASHMLDKFIAYCIVVALLVWYCLS
tara:strand:+ start:39 stop:218 length:180 start_codon:yes stop_codon:yes gene_type:complete